MLSPGMAGLFTHLTGDISAVPLSFDQALRCFMTFGVKSRAIHLLVSVHGKHEISQKVLWVRSLFFASYVTSQVS